ncbi:MAG TPA: DUF433 domain-containing protein [Bdellovibrionota bacterium]|nr:DUF433 domain-containing protein [Bdellovibrionota bacterium]
MVKAEHIEINPDIMLGKPVIKGTRITVELILRKLGEGSSVQDVIQAYPTLTADDVRAALLYAANTIAHEEYIPVDH